MTNLFAFVLVNHARGEQTNYAEIIFSNNRRRNRATYTGGISLSLSLFLSRRDPLRFSVSIEKAIALSGGNGITSEEAGTGVTEGKEGERRARSASPIGTHCVP
jgi:hypothetical protein